MNAEPTEILSAFLDGEEVDPRELAEAFQAPGAREALRDFTLLRAEIVADDTTPSARFYERMNSLVRPGARREGRRRWWQVVVPVPAPALAAVAVVVIGLAIWLGAARVGWSGGTEPPPVPDRVVHFVAGEDWR